MIRLIPLFLCAMALTACVTTTRPAEDYLARHTAKDPKPSNFNVCHGYGCRLSERVSLTREWDDLVAPLMEPPEDPAEERRLVAEVIAGIEMAVGEKTLTDEDVGGTFVGFGEAGQQDCIDETINTTTYLVMLKEAGLLHWHEPRVPVSRGFFINGWPHTTAVLAEIDSGDLYVVDSWFHGNGVPPEVVALDDWIGGWSPDDVMPAVSFAQASDAAS